MAKKKSQRSVPVQRRVSYTARGVGNNKVTISARPSRVSQLRVLQATLRAARLSKTLDVRPGGNRMPLCLLVEIGLAQEEQRFVNIDSLRKALRLTQASTSRQVAAQVRAGAIEPYQINHDTRKTFVRLTRKGIAYLDEVLAAMREAVIAERERQAQDEK